MIYEEYVTTDDGYFFNFNSGKLTDAYGRTIDMSLIYTCRLIAAEMHGLALQRNTITFTTVYSDDLRIRAGRFQSLMDRLQHQENIILAKALPWFRPPYSLPSAPLVEDVDRWFPEFRPILDRLLSPSLANNPPLRRSILRNSWGEAPSLYRRFLGYLLCFLSAQPQFGEIVALDRGPESYPTDVYAKERSNSAAFLTLDYAPWATPSEEDLLQMDHALDIYSERDRKSSNWYLTLRDRRKYRFSAVSAAIQFIASLSDDTRTHIRRLIVHEDYGSVVQPECHAQGLIPFCLENPRLHIERRVDLWRAILVPGTLPREVYCSVNPISPLKLHSATVTRSIAPWLVEAAALPSLGMPADSFSLVIDGDPVSALSSQVFDIVKRDVVWQVCADDCYRVRGFQRPDFFTRRQNPAYRYEAFPEIVDSIIARNSFIRCNFPIPEWGQLERLVRGTELWTATEWGNTWDGHEPKQFETEAPLPKWWMLFEENFMQKDVINVI